MSHEKGLVLTGIQMPPSVLSLVVPGLDAPAHQVVHVGGHRRADT